MNSKHVEVLREMRNWMASTYWDSRVVALDAALASLSAPQPPAEPFVCTGDEIRCYDGNGCECAMQGKQPPAEAQPVACDWPSCDCTNGGAECGRKISQTPSAPVGVDWRAMYRFQSAMRYMDNNPKLTTQQADKMADDDVAGLEAALAQQPAVVDGAMALTVDDVKWLQLVRQELFRRLDVAKSRKAVDNIDSRIVALDKAIALAAQQGGEK